MPCIKTILIEAALVVGVLTTGIAAAHAAHAAPLQVAIQAADPRANVKIESKILVERIEQDAAGQVSTKLYNPAEVKVIPGDKLVFVNTYNNTSNAAVTGFVVNNPVHPAVTFAEVNEDWAMLSVDGGNNFGKLTELKITETPEATAEAASTSVTRAAQPGDVTHIRWTFDQAIAAGASGELRFTGLVK